MRAEPEPSLRAIPPQLAAEIAGNLAAVNARIAAAARATSRAFGEIGLVAVTKTQPLDRVRAALAGGHQTVANRRNG